MLLIIPSISVGLCSIGQTAEPSAFRIGKKQLQQILIRVSNQAPEHRRTLQNP
jgi:hypothetical protein